MALPVPLTSYCSTVADDICNRVIPCCTSVGFASDLAYCKSLESAACETRVATAQKAGLVYDAQAAGTCLASSGTFFEGCLPATLSHWAERPVQAACTHVFVGKAKEGETCQKDDDCAPTFGASVGCGRVVGATDGTCRKIPRASSGSSCNLKPEAPFVDCDDRSECVLGSSGSICLGPVAKGGSCSFGATGPGTVATGTCDDGLACDSVKHLCLPPAESGEDCTRACAKGLVCTYFEGYSRCMPLPKDGERCNGQCAGSARCILGVCGAPRAIGEPCSNQNDCASTYCSYSMYAGSTSTCQEPPPGYVPYLYVPGVDSLTCQRNIPKK